jgi:hypothetical protein
MVACDSGTSPAPNAPCSKRNITIWSRLLASPQSTEANVKPARQAMNNVLRPKRADSQPTGAVMIAAATI